MIQNKFGELIFDESDLFDLIMQGRSVDDVAGVVVNHKVDLVAMLALLDPAPGLVSEQVRNCTIDEFHRQQQSNWHMPDEYKQLDIAQHVLSLCQTEAELQRCGAELLLYQERDLFDLLRYLKYLVDLMTKHNIVWGVGRGSSVASYVLFKLGVHRIDSLFYNLDVAEFLR